MKCARCVCCEARKVARYGDGSDGEVLDGQWRSVLPVGTRVGLSIAKCSVCLGGELCRVTCSNDMPC